MYTDTQLQDHELNYWKKHFHPPLLHERWYKEFFNFKELKGKKVVDIGCGGYPVSEYSGVDSEMTLVDPLLDKLISIEKFSHLGKYNRFCGSILNYTSSGDKDYVICLNVIDHFHDPDFIFLDRFHECLKPEGILWLYYDVRPQDSCDHLAIDDTNIQSKLKKMFEILKIDETINPNHVGWSGITKSVRIIAKKK